jgi:hypothetical protein
VKANEVLEFLTWLAHFDEKYEIVVEFELMVDELARLMANKGIIPVKCD